MKLEDHNREGGMGDIFQKFQLRLGVGTQLSTGVIDSRPLDLGKDGRL